jgi:hypothetical protein
MKKLMIIFLMCVSFEATSQSRLNEVNRVENKIFYSVSATQKLTQIITDGDTTYLWQFKNWKYNLLNQEVQLRFTTKELFEFMDTCLDVIDNDKKGNAFGFSMSPSAMNTATLLNSTSEIYVYKMHIKKIKKELQQ